MEEIRRTIAIDQFIKEQVEKWKKHTDSHIPVITISAEPGSGGHIIAKAIAKRFNFDMFDRDIIGQIADSARISSTVIESMEKERLSGIKDFIASLIDDRYLYPGVYIRHLMKVVSVIGKHGQAVIVGRGANFILPPNERLAIRVIAPLTTRMKKVADEFGVTLEEAKRRVINREAKRAAFVHQAFHAEVNDPLNYDLVLNTDKLTIDAAVGAVVGLVIGGKDFNIDK